jgi:hypothetical protein
VVRDSGMSWLCIVVKYLIGRDQAKQARSDPVLQDRVQPTLPPAGIVLGQATPHWPNPRRALGVTIAIFLGALLLSACSQYPPKVSVPRLVPSTTSKALSKSSGSGHKGIVPKGQGQVPDRTARPEHTGPGYLYPDVVGGRFVSVFERGGLVISPPRTTTDRSPLGMDLEVVKRYASLATLQGPQVAHFRVGFGLVTLSDVGYPQGMPRFSNTPAWVVFIVPRSNIPYSCPSANMRVNAKPVSRNVGPIDEVLIFYGRAGNGAAMYETGGLDPCGNGVSKPSLGFAHALVDVPWHLVGEAGISNTLIYDTWSCASLAGTSANGLHSTFTVNITVSVPFMPYGQPGCHPTVAETRLSVFPTDTGPGGPFLPALPIKLLHSPAPQLMPRVLRFPPA